MAVFRAPTWLSRTFSTVASHPLRVCLVGSGSAGFYTAEKMLKAHQEAEVDIIDRLPTPFGLVRSGVAPDHPEIKTVVNQFTRVAKHKCCSFFGNVNLGTSVTLSELRELYDMVVLAYGAESVYGEVVLAYGAESDRVLGFPGEATIPGFLLRGLSTEEGESFLKNSVTLAVEARNNFWEVLKASLENHRYNNCPCVV